MAASAPGDAEQTASRGNAQVTRPEDSTPNAGGPRGAAGDMGVSSQRSDASGGTDDPHAQDVADGSGSDGVEPQPEENPQGIPPKAGYPARDPRHHEHPYKAGPPASST